MKITICESCKIELSKIGLKPNEDSCRACGNNPKNKVVKLNGEYSPTDSIKGFIPQIPNKCIECNEKENCDTCPLVWGDDFQDNFSQGEADQREQDEYFSMEEERRIQDLLECE